MAQILKIDEYSDGRLKIDHLDTHHHLVDNSNIRQVIIDISKKLNIPIRNDNINSVKSPDVLYKNFTINNVNVECLKQMISEYKEKDVIVELMTHPGFIDEYTKTITSYLNREEELRVLMEAKINGLFDEFELISYSLF